MRRNPYEPVDPAVREAWRGFWLAYIAVISAHMTLAIGGTPEMVGLQKVEQDIGRAMAALELLCKGNSKAEFYLGEANNYLEQIEETMRKMSSALFGSD